METATPHRQITRGRRRWTLVTRASTKRVCHFLSVAVLVRLRRRRLPRPIGALPFVGPFTFSPAAGAGSISTKATRVAGAGSRRLSRARGPFHRRCCPGTGVLLFVESRSLLGRVTGRRIGGWVGVTAFWNEQISRSCNKLRESKESGVRNCDVTYLSREGGKGKWQQLSPLPETPVGH